MSRSKRSQFVVHTILKSRFGTSRLLKSHLIREHMAGVDEEYPLDGDVMAKFVPNVRRATLAPIIRDNVQPGSTVHTDEPRILPVAG